MSFCEDPGSSLVTAANRQNFVNGASHVGSRPVIVSQRLVEGEVLVLQIYCPDKLEDYQSYIDGLKYDEVIKN